MCKYNLNNSSDVKKWLLKNHPDKGGKISPDEFNKVIECYQTRSGTCESIICRNDELSWTMSSVGCSLTN